MMSDSAALVGHVAVNNVRSPVLDVGPRSSEAVVFVHGNPGSRLDWTQLMGAVSPFARAVALDMPGFGEADRPVHFEYTVEGYTRHLTGALEQLHVSRAHLVLHDFGGAWGLAWAAAHPAQVASLTLINIGVMDGYQWHYLARIWRAPVIGEIFMAITTLAGFRLLLKHGNPRGLPRPFVDQMWTHFDRRTRRAVLQLYRATSDTDRLFSTIRQALSGLNLPVLVIWGKHDPYVPVKYAERQREVFPHAEITVLNDSGHWPYADNPDAVANLVIPFLKRQVDRMPRARG
jgi:pimeloyl-ACP methyl ester carboxylesterase